MADAAGGAPPIFDIAALLTPIPGDDRVGPNLRDSDPAGSPYWLARDLVQDALASEKVAIADHSSDPSSVLAERDDKWRRVRDTCAAILRGKSKDIQIVTWLVDALVRLHGIAGLTVGLDFVCRFLEAYWSDMNLAVASDDPAAKGYEIESFATRSVEPLGQVTLLPGSNLTSTLSQVVIERMRREGRLDEAKAAALAAGEDYFRSLTADVQEAIRQVARIESLMHRELGAHRPSIDELTGRLAEIERSLVAISGAFLVASDDDPYFVNIPALLAPVPGGARAGVDLRDADGQFTALRELRMMRQDALEAERTWRLESAFRDRIESEDRERWQRIKTRCADVLQRTSKDIEVVGLLSEALVKLHGMAGLYTALQFVSRFLEEYWDDMHHPGDPDDPEVTKDLVLGHLDGRLGAWVMLMPATPRLMGKAPVTFEALRPGYGSYDQTNEPWIGALAAAEAGGPDFYQPLLASIRGAKAEWQAIVDFAHAKLGDYSPYQAFGLDSALRAAEEIAGRIARPFHV